MEDHLKAQLCEGEGAAFVKGASTQALKRWAASQLWHMLVMLKEVQHHSNFSVSRSSTCTPFQSTPSFLNPYLAIRKDPKCACHWRQHNALEHHNTDESLTQYFHLLTSSILKVPRSHLFHLVSSFPCKPIFRLSTSLAFCFYR